MTMRLFFALSSILMQVFLVSCQTTKSQNAKNDDDIDTQLGVVASFIDGGTPDKALKEIKPLVEAYPEDARVQNMMGLTQLILRNFNRSIAHLQKSFTLDEKVSTGLNLGAALIESGKYAEAEKLLKKLTTMKENPPYRFPERIYLNLGVVYEKTNRVHLAEKNYKRSLEENPTYYMARLQLARLYQNTKRVHLAIATLEEAHSNCPICLEPVTDLTNNYVKVKNSDKAEKLLSKYLKTEGVRAEDRDAATNILNDLKKTPPTKVPLSTNSNR